MSEDVEPKIRVQFIGPNVQTWFKQSQRSRNAGPPCHALSYCRSSCSDRHKNPLPGRETLSAQCIRSRAWENGFLNLGSSSLREKIGALKQDEVAVDMGCRISAVALWIVRILRGEIESLVDLRDKQCSRISLSPHKLVSSMGLTMLTRVAPSCSLARRHNESLNPGCYYARQIRSHFLTMVMQLVP